MQIDVARRTSVAGGYSWVKVDYGDRYDAAGLYKDATYIFCNLFIINLKELVFGNLLAVRR